MNKEFFITESRRTTPWTGDADATELQQFIDRKVDSLYAEKHLALSEAEEARLLIHTNPRGVHTAGMKNTRATAGHVTV